MVHKWQKLESYMESMLFVFFNINGSYLAPNLIHTFSKLIK